MESCVYGSCLIIFIRISCIKNAYILIGHRDRADEWVSFCKIRCIWIWPYWGLNCSSVWQSKNVSLSFNYNSLDSLKPWSGIECFFILLSNLLPDNYPLLLLVSVRTCGKLTSGVHGRHSSLTHKKNHTHSFSPCQKKKHSTKHYFHFTFSFLIVECC